MMGCPGLGLRLIGGWLPSNYWDGKGSFGRNMDCLAFALLHVLITGVVWVLFHGTGGNAAEGSTRMRAGYVLVLYAMLVCLWHC